jgi:hypothetical protein
MARSRRKQFVYNDWSGGLQAFTAPLWTRDKESPFNNSIDNQIPGQLTKGLGYSQIGGTGTSGKVKGLAVFEKEDGTDTWLKIHDTTLYKLASGVWTSVDSTFTSNSTDKAEIVEAYADNTERVYIVTGHNDNLAHWDGTTFARVTDVKAKHIGVYRNRIYLGNVKLGSTVSPTRVQFSGLGVDTFDTTNDYFDDVGEPITAMKVYAGVLNIFSENKLMRYDGYALRGVAGEFGTTSERSVKVAQGRLLWYNRQGVYIWGGTEIPTLISRQVKGFLDAITDPTSVSGGVDKFGRYKLYIGDITYEGVSYTDVVLTYDVLIDSWSFEDKKPYGVMATARDGGGFVSYAGDVDNDKVWKVDDTYTNNAEAIASEWQTNWFDIKTPESTKNFYELHVTYKPTGQSEFLTIQYRLDGGSGWQAIEGTANNIDLSGSESIATTVLRMPPQTQGRYIQFKISHSSDTYGFTLYEMRVEADVISQN